MANSPAPYEQWLRAVGLPADFPALYAVEFDEPIEHFYRGPQHEALIEAALQSLAQPAVANLIPDGHGVTTISRYVYSRSRSSAIDRAIVPVHLSFEDLLALPISEGGPGRELEALPMTSRYRALLDVASHQPAGADQTLERAEELAADYYSGLTIPVVQKAIDDAIQKALVVALMTQPWERIIGRQTYSGLLSTPTASDEDLSRRRSDLTRRLEMGGAPAAIANELSPKLASGWQDLMPELFEASRLRLSLQFDLSPSPIGRYYTADGGHGETLTQAYENALLVVAAALKNTTQMSRQGGSGYLNRAFFLSPNAWSVFESDVALTVETSEFPSYSPLDVFTILAVHYRRSTGGQIYRQDELAAVLDQSLIPRDNHIALSTLSVMLAAKLKDVANQDLRFQLSELFSGMWGSAQVRETISDIQGWQQEVDEWRTGVDEALRALARNIGGMQGGS